MKKYLSLILIGAFALSLIACGVVNTTYHYYGTPKNGIFDAPDEFYLEWDIPSVRDISVSKEGHYSMPVYMFETFEELAHLKEIIAMYEIGSEINSTDYCELCYSSDPCSHDKYNEEFFEHYTLLIGWHQYVGVVIGEHIEEKPEEKPAPDVNGEEENPNTDGEEASPEGEDIPDVQAQIEDEEGNELPEEEIPDNATDKTVFVAKYEIGADGSLTVFLQGERAEGEAAQQWVLVAVPKNVIADCDSIAFFVKLPEETQE